MMFRRAFLVLLLTVVFAWPATAAEPGLQGNWRVLSAMKGNRKLTAKECAELKVSIMGRQFKLLGGSEELVVAELSFPMKFGVRAFDLTITNPEPSKSLGIYELSGNKLRLCWDNRLNERPEKFSGENESASLILLQLERTKP